MANTVRLYDPNALDLPGGEYTGHWSCHADAGIGVDSGYELEFPVAIPDVPSLVIVFYVGTADPTLPDGFTFDSASPPAWTSYWGSYTDDASNWPGFDAVVYSPPATLSPFSVDPASDAAWWRHGPLISSSAPYPPALTTTGCDVTVTGVGMLLVTAVDVEGTPADFYAISDTELHFGMPDVTLLSGPALEPVGFVRFTLTAPHGTDTGLLAPGLDHDPYEEINAVPDQSSLVSLASGRDQYAVAVHKRMTSADDLYFSGLDDSIGASLWRGSIGPRYSLFALAWWHTPGSSPEWFGAASTWPSGGYLGGPDAVIGPSVGGGTADVLSYSAYAHPFMGYILVTAARAVYADFTTTTPDHGDVAAVILQPDGQGRYSGPSSSVGTITSGDSSWWYDNFLDPLTVCSFERSPGSSIPDRQPYPPIGVPLSDALAVVFSGDVDSAVHYAVLDLAPLFSDVEFTGQRSTGTIPGLDATLSPPPPAVKDAWRIDDTHVLILTGDNQLIAMDASTGTFGTAVAPSTLAAEPTDVLGWHQRIAVVQTSPTDFYVGVSETGGDFYLDQYTVSGTTITRTSRLLLPDHTFTFGVLADTPFIDFTHDIDTGDPYIVYGGVTVDPAGGQLGPGNPDPAGTNGPFNKSTSIYDFESGYLAVAAPPGEIRGTRSHVITCTPYSAPGRWSVGAVLIG